MREGGYTINENIFQALLKMGNSPMKKDEPKVNEKTLPIKNEEPKENQAAVPSPISSSPASSSTPVPASSTSPSLSSTNPSPAPPSPAPQLQPQVEQPQNEQQFQAVPLVHVFNPNTQTWQYCPLPNVCQMFRMEGRYWQLEELLASSAGSYTPDDRR